jgi:hypothetical protein
MRTGQDPSNDEIVKIKESVLAGLYGYQITLENTCQRPVIISKRSWILTTTISYRIHKGVLRPLQILAGAKP